MRVYHSIAMLYLALLLPLSTANAIIAPECRDAWSKMVPHLGHFYTQSAQGDHFLNNHNTDYAKWYQKLDRQHCLKDWTILIYMQADNDLTPYALWDLYEMESSFKKKLAGSTLKTDVLVHLDTKISDKIRRLHIFQSKRKHNPKLTLEYFEQQHEGSIHSPTVDFIEEVDEEQRPQREDFSQFVDWAIKKYPSKHYMLVVWGHGQGWSFDSAVQFGGVALDETQNSRIHIPEVARAIKGKNIEIVTSDACLMQTLEVATELAPVTKYIIGSTQVHNYMGMPYRRMLYEINSGNFLGLKRKLQSNDESYILARMIPILFKQSFDPLRGYQGRLSPEAINSLTMGSLSSWQIDNVLIPQLDRLSKLLLEYFQYDPFGARMFATQLDNVPRFLGGSRDIATVLGFTKSFFSPQLGDPLTDKIVNQLDKTFDALDATIVSYAFGNDYKSFYKLNSYYSGFFRSFGFWLPDSALVYQKYKGQFAQTRLYKRFLADSWAQLLETIYPAGPLRPFLYSPDNFNETVEEYYDF